MYKLHCYSALSLWVNAYVGHYCTYTNTNIKLAAAAFE